MQGATYLELPRALTRFVKHVRVTEGLAERAVRYERLPDGEAEIVVQVHAGVLTRTGVAVEATDGSVSRSMQTRGDGALLHLVGLRTTAFQKRPEPLRSAVVVRFHAAGAYPFFGRPMSELTDRFAMLQTLWGRETARIEDAVGEGPRAGGDALVAHLEARLADATVFEPASSLAVRRAVARVRTSSALPTVKRLAADVGVSERQLRRAFDEVVGVGPKHYLRIARFDRVLRLAARRADWSAIADTVGYADQAHRIGEFREMTGETPAAFVARRREPAMATRAQRDDCRTGLSSARE